MANEDRLPQFDRAKIKTPIGFFSTLFRLMRISEEFAIPAIVKEYDRNTGIVKVQPLVSNLADDVNNREVEIPRSEYEVHVVRFAHGGYVVDAPLFVGDTGWLIAGDRNSTSAIKANSTILEEDQTDENSPNEGYKKPDDNSLKSFAWGFFIPDTWGITDFTEEDGLVVRGQRISVESDHVTVECGENSASISKESVNIDTKKCSIEIKEDHASVISGKYGAKIDGNGAIVEGPNDKISIDDNGLHHEGVVDEKRNVISAIEYDEEIGDIIKKSFLVSKRGDLIVDIDEETDWERLGLPSANDGKLTIKQDDTTLGEFTANQADNTTVTIPAPPVVNDGTLTIKQGETILGTFTANQANDNPVTIVIPNPPTPTNPGNGLITITQGSTTLGTFTVNQSGDSTIRIPVVPVFGIVITQVPIDPSTTPDHPGGGVRITFQPTQDGVPVGQPTVVDLWNGSGGGGGGTDLSNTPALDVVATDGSAAGQASAGVAVTASRSDHVHKMPATVVLTDADQTINSIKTIMPSGNNANSHLRFKHNSNNSQICLQYGPSGELDLFQIWKYTGDGTGGIGNLLIALGTFLELGARGTGTGAIDDVRLGSGADTALAAIAPKTSGTDARRIVDVRWVTNKFQQKLIAGSNITISSNTISAVIPESLPNPYSLRVYGNPTSNAGTGIASPNPTIYNGSAQIDIHLDGLVTKGTNQTITSSKTFSTSSGGLKFATANDNNVTMRGFGSSTGLGIYVGNSDTSGRILTASSAGGAILIGGPSDGSYPAVRLGSTPSVSPSSMSSTTETQVPTLKWVNNNYQQKLTAGSNITISRNTISATQPTVNNGTLTIKQGTTTLGTFTANQSGNTTVTIPTPTPPPSGTVNFIADMRWNTTTHTLQKRVDSLNMATGAVTQGTWSDITNGGTTPISSILPQSSS